MKKLLKVMLTALLGVTLVACSSTTSDNTDSTNSFTEVSVGSLGTIQGSVSSEDSSLIEYKGVRYAENPGRFEYSEYLTTEGIYDEDGDCTTNKAVAPQYTIVTAADGDYSFFYGDEDYTIESMSEDCFYLTITSPAESSDENLPVYVWIHGGALKHGYAYESEFDATSLAQQGIIVVSVEYRLGALGYLTSSTLSENGYTGNYGLSDQVSALEWVQHYISYFGGDPDNVTVGGQSAGAMSVSALLEYNDANNLNLFKNAILETNFSVGTSLEDAISNGDTYLENIGLNDLSMDELLELPWYELMGMESEDGTDDFTNFLNYMGNGGTLTLDGVYLTESITDYFNNTGTFGNVNVLYGSNLGDSNATVSSIPETVVDADSFYEFVKDTIGDELYNSYDIEAMYPCTDDDYIDVAVEFLSDIENMQYRYYGIANSLSNSESNSIYTYFFTYCVPVENDTTYAEHSSELWYAFDSMNSDKENQTAYYSWSQEDYDMADIVSTYWANFIKTGNPNDDNLDNWEANTSLQYMELGDKSKNTVSVSLHNEIDEKDIMLFTYTVNLLDLNNADEYIEALESMYAE